LNFKISVYVGQPQLEEDRILIALTLLASNAPGI